MAQPGLSGGQEEGAGHTTSDNAFVIGGRLQEADYFLSRQSSSDTAMSEQLCVHTRVHTWSCEVVCACRGYECTHVHMHVKAENNK